MATAGYLTVLALGMLPAVGNFTGGLLAESIRVSERTLSLALHLAAGVVLGVIGIELMPEALTVNPAWMVLAAFVAGGGFSIVVDELTNIIEKRTESTSDAGPWAIYFGVAVDLFSDGIMIGTGSVISLGLGLLLALGQVTADIPEGFATIATFKDRDVSRRLRLLLSASFLMPVVVGVTIGYWAVRGQPPLVKFGLLAFTAGVLLTVVIEDIVPEAHEEEDARLASIALVGGFALFGLTSVYLG